MAAIKYVYGKMVQEFNNLCCPHCLAARVKIERNDYPEDRGRYYCMECKKRIEYYDNGWGTVHRGGKITWLL